MLKILFITMLLTSSSHAKDISVDQNIDSSVSNSKFIYYAENNAVPFKAKLFYDAANKQFDRGNLDNANELVRKMKLTLLNIFVALVLFFFPQIRLQFFFML